MNYIGVYNPDIDKERVRIGVLKGGHGRSVLQIRDEKIEFLTLPRI